MWNAAKAIIIGQVIDLKVYLRNKRLKIETVTTTKFPANRSPSEVSFIKHLKN